MIDILKILIVLGAIQLGFADWVGKPPLYDPHPEIEYINRPNQDVHYFGNRIRYNSHSMRSPEPGDAPQERFVLVLGDSVVNGGRRLHQREIATSLATDRETLYGNASARSWGPQNMHAWLNAYDGWQPDQLILVLSSHDFSDVPTFDELPGLTHPSRSSGLIAEAFGREALIWLRKFKQRSVQRHSTARSDKSTMVWVERIIDLARERGASVCAIQHLTRDEMKLGPDERHAKIRQTLEAQGVEPLQLADTFRGSELPLSAIYRDHIHLSEQGQELLAEALRGCEG